MNSILENPIYENCLATSKQIKTLSPYDTAITVSENTISDKKIGLSSNDKKKTIKRNLIELEELKLSACKNKTHILNSSCNDICKSITNQNSKIPPQETHQYSSLPTTPDNLGDFAFTSSNSASLPTILQIEYGDDHGNSKIIKNKRAWLKRPIKRGSSFLYIPKIEATIPLTIQKMKFEDVKYTFNVKKCPQLKYLFSKDIFKKLGKKTQKNKEYVIKNNSDYIKTQVSKLK